MKTFFVKIADREEGPYSEAQVSQIFADGRIERHSPCRLAPDGAWKTIDELLPMLKYGTQLPPPTSPPRLEVQPAPLPQPPRLSEARAEMRVSVVDFDLPFASIVKLMFKWMAAGFLVFCCFIPAFIVLVIVVMAIFGSLLGGLLNGFHHP